MGLSIRQQIVIIFSAFIIISLVLVGAIGVLFSVMSGDQAISQSTVSLETQITTNLQLTASKNADIIDQKLKTAEMYVTNLAEQVKSLLQPNSSFGYRQSFYDYNFEQGNLNGPLLPNDTFSDMVTYKSLVSFNYSSFFIKGAAATYLPSVTPRMAVQLNATANLDFFFQSTHLQQPEYGWLYVAFDNGLMRLYPGTKIYGNTERNSDYRLDGWYNNARNAGGVITYTEPYFDTEGGLGLMISITKLIKDPVNNEDVVVGLDITVKDLQSKVLAVNILNGGYASLIQKPNGLVIAHPKGNLSRDDQLITEIEPSTVSAMSSILISQTGGVTKFTKNNEQYILAYQPLEKSKLIFLVFIPRSLVIGPVTLLQAHLNQSTIELISSTLVIAAICIIISLMLGNLIAQRIVNSIAKITKLLTNLSNDKVRNNVTDQFDTLFTSLDDMQPTGQQNDEITDLAQAFKGMMKAVKEDTEKKIEAEKTIVVDW